MSEKNLQIVRRLVDAFNNDDVEGVVGAFDEDCQLAEPPEMPDSPADGYRGHDGIRAWMANLRDTGSIRFEPRSFRTIGDVVLSQWDASGLGPASGIAFNWTTFVVFRLHGGKVVQADAFLSEDEALKAAGLSA